ncbi:triosephosphate isomerase [Vanrija albida]|uniref:Triosephosphate isomerase n=1 Tax=Vanrija albida TaxID=181172 RepID=A0ABR3Q2U9_9TREE
MPRKFFVGGNFKMNGSQASIKTIVDGLNDAKLDGANDVVIAPPALYLISVAKAVNAPVQVAAQNAYVKQAGAFTGEISPEQIKDAGVPWVILGHSERRSLFHDSDSAVAEKVKLALETGLKVIACIGETLEEREKGITSQVNQRQLEAIAAAIPEASWKDVVVAYEPVWAIGTGKVATVEQAQEVHADLRKWLAGRVSPAVAEATRIIYGGSVTAKNSPELAKAEDIDGFLVGGASLKPEFVEIARTKA